MWVAHQFIITRNTNEAKINTERSIYICIFMHEIKIAPRNSTYTPNKTRNPINSLVSMHKAYMYVVRKLDEPVDSMQRTTHSHPIQSNLVLMAL